MKLLGTKQTFFTSRGRLTKRINTLRVIRSHEEDQAQLLPTAKAKELQRIFQFRNVKGLSHRIYYSLM